ncbi:MAG: hypothetical protein NTU41_05815 [Chloroflexi bacterium]|nr:hypothetical protein [Chloroflexota bacterium]
MGSTATIVILMVIVILIAVVLPMWGTRRATPAVISTFRHYDAVGKSNAKTLDEIGLKPAKTGFIQAMFTPRDYRIPALRALIKTKVVQITEEGKAFLSEENLADSRWKGL